jgi:glutamate synthase (NADPH) small chain
VANTRMLSFTHLGQDFPEKRAADARSQDFHEISQPFLIAKAEEQASRCSQCGVPFCQVHCPLQNHIPDWLKLAAEGRLREAYELSTSTSTMPEICGRICPQDRLCEGNCVIEQSGHGAVTIGSVEKFITDTAWQEGWVEPVVPLADRSGQSVGIIGAGPAGLTAAELLRVRGYDVHVYDRHDRAGGLLIYGIPGFKLEKEVVERRVKRLVDGGIHFHMNTNIGTDISFAELRQRHDAILVATGVYKPRPLGLAGSALPGVVRALDYLMASNRVGLGDTVPAFTSGELSAEGRDVVVIGGGDTAMDCVRTAVRQGAKSVTCLYRRDRANMPGSQREVYNAEEEGVRFEWLAAPAAFAAGQPDVVASGQPDVVASGQPDVVASGSGGSGRVTSVTATRMRLGNPDASGRRTPQPEPDQSFTLPADLVIEALGFDPEDLPGAFAEPALAVTRWGTIKADGERLSTSLPGVFAAGDIVRGASLVVWAIREGRDVAQSMHAWLKAQAQGAESRGAQSRGAQSQGTPSPTSTQGQKARQEAA